MAMIDTFPVKVRWNQKQVWTALEKAAHMKKYFKDRVEP